jgi:hypothetical protein
MSPKNALLNNILRYILFGKPQRWVQSLLYESNQIAITYGIEMILHGHFI